MNKYKLFFFCTKRHFSHVFALVDISFIIYGAFVLTIMHNNKANYTELSDTYSLKTRSPAPIHDGTRRFAQYFSYFSYSQKLTF